MGMIFFFIYMLFVSFILVNFFLTIILISFKHVKDSWTEETNQYEIVEYVAGKFKKLFGIGKAGDAQSRIDSRFAYIADELDIEEQEREIQLKVDSMMDRLLLCDDWRAAGQRPHQAAAPAKRRERRRRQRWESRRPRRPTAGVERRCLTI
uniref:Ion_trans domain-containing protein n=1 Tax=Macrostomum lignano TaxID=282301 RepID=A0A1I8HYL1_9PLAT